MNSYLRLIHTASQTTRHSFPRMDESTDIFLRSPGHMSYRMSLLCIALIECAMSRIHNVIYREMCGGFIPLHAHTARPTPFSVT